MSMTTEADSPRGVTRLQKAAAAGGVLGAVAATILVAAAIAFNFLAPLLSS